MTIDASHRDRPEAAVRGYHFETACRIPGRQVLAQLEDAVSPAIVERHVWQISTIHGRRYITVMPRRPWTRPEATSLRRALESLPHGVRTGPIGEIVPNVITRVAIEADEPPSDWFWPKAERPTTDEFKGAPKIRIAHIDTGVSDHPCLHGRIDGANSRDYVGHSSRPRGHGVWCWGRSLKPWYMPDHGTSTAALITGGPSSDPAFNGEVAGIIPPDLADLIPIRAVAVRPLIEPWDERRVANAINWAVRQGRCSVISISIGDPLWSQAIEDAIWRAAEAGVIVCAAAGQTYPLPIWPALTAMDHKSICCGGSTVERRPFPASGWGSFPDDYVTIAAPAVHMPKATWRDHICSTQEPRLMRSEGTSYAAPFVAGVAALWRTRHWEALADLPPDEIVRIFRQVLQLPSNVIPWDSDSGPLAPRYGPGIISPRAVVETAPDVVSAAPGRHRGVALPLFRPARTRLEIIRM